ncbi:MAG: tRNA (adenosine(37)-N6)-dimethylallyltransferase MiaA [Saprospiraceae bacterium]|nr:tRNA (adenosine(37)-N6)-dimethylallyltransferase MiaA [Saprospiraceae bacterium]
MNHKRNYLIVVGGPTAVGKTSVAISLATNLKTEIISADSRQIYRQMNIGTAKPSADQLDRVQHHFINELDIDQPFTAADFEFQGLKRLQSVFIKNQVAILSGGTGLYIHALCHGLDKIPNIDSEVRNRFQTLYQDKGLVHIQQLLREKDPQYANTVDLQNHRRLIRALTVIDATGRPFSSFLSKGKDPRFFEPIYILLKMDRSKLYERINTRVDQMIAAGLEEEARGLQQHFDLTALQTVGYQEWGDYLKGDIDRAEVIRLIKRNSRRYAKRQLTWFRKHGLWQIFSPDDLNGIKDFISSRMQTQA